MNILTKAHLQGLKGENRNTHKHVKYTSTPKTCRTGAILASLRAIDDSDIETEHLRRIYCKTQPNLGT